MPSRPRCSHAKQRASLSGLNRAEGARSAARCDVSSTACAAPRADTGPAAPRTRPCCAAHAPGGSDARSRTALGRGAGAAAVSPSSLRSIYLRLAGVVMLVVVLALGCQRLPVSPRLRSARWRRRWPRRWPAAAPRHAQLVLKAMEHQIAFRELYGVEQTFDELKRSIPDIAYVAVTDAAGSGAVPALQGAGRRRAAIFRQSCRCWPRWPLPECARRRRCASATSTWCRCRS